MDARRAGRQIRQLVDFIKLEAREKATEIRLKAEHDFNVEKQKLVVAAKKKLGDDFGRKEKEMETRRRIASSKNVGSQRQRKYVARDEYLQKLREEAKARLHAVSQSQTYGALLESLIIQGYKRLGVNSALVLCREADLAVARSAASAASAKLGGGTAIAVNEKKHLDARCAGGVKVTTEDGKITCDNTLESRLELTVHDLEPAVRYALFPSCRAEKRDKPPAVREGEEDLLA